MNRTAQKTWDVAKHKGTLWSGGTVITLIGMFIGYDKVGAPAMDVLSTSVNDILVSMKSGEVRENIIIKQNERLLDYQELRTRLEFRADDIQAVKTEMAIEKEWD